MKAKVIETGEIVDVMPIPSGYWVETTIEYTRQWEEAALDFKFNEWDAFRREAAKDILASISMTFISIEDTYLRKGVALSVKLADELIRQLKEDQV